MSLASWAGALVIALVPLVASAQPAVPVFGAGGVPQAIAKARDYDQLFATLKGAGIDIFFPTFQTQEAPTVQTLGFETDFLMPCSAEAPAFKAMRRHGVRLLIPGELLYPADQALLPLDQDPLRRLIACTGRDGLFGVLNHDEPAHNNTNESASKRLYERVKQIDPTLPVLMVHAPIVLDQDRHKTAEGRAAYLDEARRHSAFADIVGFDVYPVPPTVAFIGSPFRGDEVVDHATAIRDYMTWIRTNVPDKKHLMVLQGFSYQDQYSPWYFTLIGQHVKSIVRPPSRQETREMAQLAVDGGASVVIWWGLSMLKETSSEPWPSVVDTVKRSKGIK